MSKTTPTMSEKIPLQALPPQALDGTTKSHWTTPIPSSWQPYIQLTRLYSPAPIFLIYFPHLFGLLYAATLQRTSVPLTLQKPLILFLGSIFFSNAAHIWNDIIDTPIDALTARTKNRPIPRGAVTVRQAVVFLATQVVIAPVWFYWFPGTVGESLAWVVPSILGSAGYPFVKRCSNYPQVVLGFCLAWGVVVGALSMGMRVFDADGFDWALVSLFVACVLWTVVYDSVYARLDRDDDVKNGVGSVAVAFGERLYALLWVLLVFIAVSLTMCGVLADLRIWYFLVSVGGATMSLGVMLLQVDLEDRDDCTWFFINGFWYVAVSISGGLALEYALPVGLKLR